MIRIVASVFALGLAASAHAADTLKIGMLTTLSGPGASIGGELRDGFMLAVKHLNHKLGGLSTEVIVADDGQNPENAKQISERFIKKEKVDIATGVVFSNILLAVAPSFFKSETFYISSNTGPSLYAGAQCNPYFFNVSWQNDSLHEVMGKYLEDNGIKKIVTVMPNYPGGIDAINGLKRFYKGGIAEEIITKLGQFDYASEIAQLRAANADAVYIFLPGAMGINFIKQYGQSGQMKKTPLYASGFSADEDVVGAVGAVMEGVLNTSHWYREMENPTNRQFVAGFQNEHRRLPTLYGAQGYDAALLIDAAIRKIDGKFKDKAALRKALETVEAPSTRGSYRFGVNHYPVQSYYLRKVTKNSDGSLSNRFVSKVADAMADAYVGDCKMP